MFILFSVFFLLLQTHAQEQCDKFKAYENYQEAKAQGVIKNIKRHDSNLGPVEDQNGIGDCYAYVTADLMESHMKSN